MFAKHILKYMHVSYCCKASDTEKVKSLPLADTHFQISAKVKFHI